MLNLFLWYSENSNIFLCYLKRNSQHVELEIFSIKRGHIELDEPHLHTYCCLSEVFWGTSVELTATYSLRFGRWLVKTNVFFLSLQGATWKKKKLSVCMSSRNLEKQWQNSMVWMLYVRKIVILIELIGTESISNFWNILIHIISRTTL